VNSAHGQPSPGSQCCGLLGRQTRLQDLTETDRQRLNGHVRSISMKAAVSRQELLQKIHTYLSFCTPVPEEMGISDGCYWEKTMK
jgi:hypothetical protein